MKIALRADASVALGAGHVMRCLALADALRAQGDHTMFLCRPTSGHLGQQILARGHAVAWLAQADQPAEELADAAADAAACVGALAREPDWDWLVVDHYALDAAWEKRLRASAQAILVIDDLANRPHDCDVLLDPNHYRDAAQRYQGLLPTRAKQWLGPRHALLRETFMQAAQTLRVRDGSVKRVLICFGGSDPHNATSKAIEMFLAAQIPGATAEVVVGAAYPHWAQLQAQFSAEPRLELWRDIDDMATRMARADLFLGAGGSLTWERAALGLAGITLALADNQRALCLDLAAAGGGLHLGDVAHATREAGVAALRTLAGQPGLLRAMGDVLRGLSDGGGARRVATGLRALCLASSLKLRRATDADIEPVYVWRNHPNTRAHFKDAAPIDPSQHRAWFTRALRDPSRDLLIAELHSQTATNPSTNPSTSPLTENHADAIGVLRFDCAGDQAVVSLYLDPARQGQGLGGALLQAGLAWLAQGRPEVRQVLADVLPANAASVATFSRAGFRVAYSRYQLDLNADAP